MTNPLPRKITPCPINEAIVEIRFQTHEDFVGDAVFGLVYNAFKSDYPSVAKQPVLQIPEHMRINDPGLMYLPEYHLTGGQFKLLVGQRVLSIVAAGEYCGWSEFSSRVDDAMGRIQALGFIRGLKRFGLRYINVFELDIFEQSTLGIVHGDAPLQAKNARIVSRIESGSYEHTLTMANGLTVRNEAGIIGESIIDIDTATTENLDGFIERRLQFMNEAHSLEKQLFFSLLRKEYLDTLNPEY